MFGGQSKEEKKEAKIQNLLQKYGMQELTDPRDIQSVREIASDLLGQKMIQLGTALQGNSADLANMALLRAQVEQNYVIIRLLNQIEKNTRK